MVGVPSGGANSLFDVNRVLSADGKMAARLVYSLWRTDYYIKGQYRNGYELAPSFSYQLSPTNKFTVKMDFVQNRETNLGGLPLDPSVGFNQTAKIARGLARDWQFGNDIDTRHRSSERGSAELLSTLGDRSVAWYAQEPEPRIGNNGKPFPPRAEDVLLRNAARTLIHQKRGTLPATSAVASAKPVPADSEVTTIMSDEGSVPF